MTTAPTFFDSPEELRKWFAKHAATAAELIVGFTKTSTGRAGLTWPQAVDEALCVGWIDGVRHGLDAERYKIRFTPRKPRSHWSAKNINRVAELEALGRMRPAGLAAFAARTEARSRRASYEQEAEIVFGDEALQAFRKHKAAWRFFAAQPPGYRRKVTWLVISPKRPETRAKRLAHLIAMSAEGKRAWD